MRAVPDQPAIGDGAASAFLCLESPPLIALTVSKAIARRHAGAATADPDACERRALEQPLTLLPFEEGETLDDGDLPPRERQCVFNELLRLVERRVADDVINRLGADKEVLPLAETTINDVGASGEKAAGEAARRDGASTARWVENAADEWLNIEQGINQPRRLAIPVIAHALVTGRARVATAASS